MRVLILIEPSESGGFRATAGEPFRVSAEAGSAEDAARQLETLLRNRLHKGTRLAFLDLENGSTEQLESPLRLDPLPDDDWFFGTMRGAIDENRQRENEAG
jgi:hypothetical protein